MDPVFFIVERDRHDGIAVWNQVTKYGPFDTKQAAYDFCSEFNSSVYSCKIMPVSTVVKSNE